ncbi:MAG: DUF971 domain-containing protein [Azospirillum sp.]|nr:DUF971 domain-containing protein [Azospirillum sp.]
METGDSLFNLAAEVTRVPDFGPAPAEIVISADGAFLEMLDERDRIERIAAVALRRACRCAWCVRARHDGTFSTRFDAVRIKNAEAIGRYAVRLHFSDGHDRGIFPWQFIREIAVDEETVIRREPSNV